MKLISSDGKQFTFTLNSREKQVLFQILELYPLIPPAHPRLILSTDPAQNSDQKLLDDSLKESRAENRRQILAMLNEPGRFARAGSGFRLALSPEQMEILLQVLNDVRVGSWILLGEPDEKKGRTAPLTPENAACLSTMELAGFFQHILLQAQRGS